MDTVKAPAAGRTIIKELFVRTTPERAFHGYLDVLINRQGGSDCETLAQAVKDFGLGPVIGTRTWGGELVVTWRSVPFISVIVFSSWCRLTATITSWSQHGLAQHFLDGGHAVFYFSETRLTKSDHSFVDRLAPKFES